jgi:hypothetical protein
MIIKFVHNICSASAVRIFNCSQIENAKHILDLNSMWLTFFNYLDEFSRDSSNLLKGTILFPEFTRQDDIFDRLFSVQDEQLNILTYSQCPATSQINLIIHIMRNAHHEFIT